MGQGMSVAMNQRSSLDPSDARLSLSQARAINDACDRFEDAWRSGRRPGIEGAVEAAASELAGPGDASREALWRELLALEIELRLGSGERPTRSDYAGRFPEHAADGRLDAVLVECLDLFRSHSQSASRSRPSAPSPSAGETVDTSTPFVSATTPLHPGTPLRFGDFELVDEIARGGMGVVYRAKQLRLNRLVALKMIVSGAFASEVERKRFRNEAEAAARLDHPRIVPIHEVGECQGYAYFSMKLMLGGSLAARRGDFVGEPETAARMVATIARAIAHAHDRGLIHRDLKPANILLDDRGQPHVTDFGLAKRADDPGGLTQSGARLGTPSYMAPEQAAGQSSRVDVRADIYSLGAILYELLTGRPPFRADTLMETVVQVLEHEPTPPGQLVPDVPPDLELICLRCLEKNPESRYPTAAALADDLERFLRDEDVEARRLGRLGRLRRWVRRESELSSRWIGLGLVGFFTQVNYINSPEPDTPLHVRVTLLELIWAIAAWCFHRLSKRPEWVDRARALWIASDIALLTMILHALKAAPNTEVLGYPLLIAASGLWSRPRLVWLTTGLSMFGYAMLLLGATVSKSNGHPNIVFAMLAVTGYVVARQVERLKALGAFYEHG